MNQARRRGTTYLSLAAVLVLCRVSISHVGWRGSAELHTLLETTATLMAFVIGAKALVRYYTQKTNKYLFLGSAFLGAGALDAYHALLTSSFFAGHTPSVLSSLTPWTGLVSWILLSAMACISSLWADDGAPVKGLHPERRVYLVVGGCTLGSFLFFALVPLPPAYVSAGWFHRPAEFVPGLGFLLAGYARFRKRTRTFDGDEHWLLLAMMTAVAYAFDMASSARLYDAPYILAHLMKILSYQFVLTGLFVSMFSVYRREAQSLGRLSEANGLLTQEIKERERAEEALRHEQGQLEMRIESRTRDLVERGRQLEAAHVEIELFLASIPSILIGLDSAGRITRWNGAARQTFGIGEVETRGRGMNDCGIAWLLPDMPAEIAQWLESLALYRCADLPFIKDGERRQVGFSVRPIATHEGQATAFIVTGADITERKRLESELAQAQKLESIGHLAAGIAHEINTPIQYVSDNTRFLEDSFRKLEGILSAFDGLLEEMQSATATPGRVADILALATTARLSYLREEIPKSIQDSLEGVSRVAEIVRAIKEFSHPGPLEKSATDLNRAIESTILVSRNEWKYVADVETNLDPSLPLTSCVAGEFNQVILNLIVNAAHAIADVESKRPGTKGRILVSTRQDGGWAEIRVQDTGSGIPEAVRSNIFNPFFTTKGVGKGTGQGLSLAHTSIVQKHGGTIAFETEVGVGTTFIVRIPIGECSPGQSDFYDGLTEEAVLE